MTGEIEYYGQARRAMPRPNTPLFNDTICYYEYDAQGRRALRVAANASKDTYSIWDSFGNLVSEYEKGLYDDPALVRNYVWGGNGELVFVDRVGAADDRFVVTDKDKSVVALLDNSGTIFASVSYDPWGVPAIAGDIAGLNVLWNGYIYDAETGSYYLKNRQYFP